MAATPAQQRRYQAALRRVLGRYRAEDEAKYQVLLREALTEVDAAEVRREQDRSDLASPAQGEDVRVVDTLNWRGSQDHGELYAITTAGDEVFIADIAEDEAQLHLGRLYVHAHDKPLTISQARSIVEATN